MHHYLGHDESLTRSQLHRPALEIDQERSFDDVEELVEIVVLVPVIPPVYEMVIVVCRRRQTNSTTTALARMRA